MGTISTCLYATNTIKSLQNFQFDYGFTVTSICTAIIYLTSSVKLIVVKTKDKAKAEYHVFDLSDD